MKNEKNWDDRNEKDWEEWYKCYYEDRDALEDEGIVVAAIIFGAAVIGLIIIMVVGFMACR